VKDKVFRMESKFVELSRKVNDFINESSNKFALKLSEDEIRLQYESCLTEEVAYPIAVLGSYDKRKGEIPFKEANSLFQTIVEKFEFEPKVIAVNGNPSSKIKTEHIIYEQEKNPFNLSLVVKEDTIDIVLQYNTMITNAIHKASLNESYNLDSFFLEEEALMEGLFSSDKYGDKMKEYELMLRMHDIPVINLNQVFDKSYISMFEGRFRVIDKNVKDGYCTYKNHWEHDMLVNYIIKLYGILLKEKKLPKDIAYGLTALHYQGQFYPMLIALNTKIRRVVGVYCFIMYPNPKQEGSFYIGISELFRSFVPELQNDFMALRKFLNCGYFD
jgi:hypothetical protein